MCPSSLKGHVDSYAWLPDELVVEETPGKPGYHCRTSLDLDEGLVASIMERGVLETIIVGRDGPKLIVVDGRQRVRHAIEANKRLKAAGQAPKKVPFRVTCADPEMWGLVAAHANIHRASSPLMLAQEIRDLEEAGRTKDEIAVAMGKSKATVADLRRLLDCDKVVQKAVESKELSLVAARGLAQLPREEQRAKLEEMRAAGTMKGSSAVRAVRAVKSGKPVPKKGDAKKMRSRELVQRVVDMLEARDIKRETAALIDFAKWILGERIEISNDDVNEVLDEIEAEKHEQRERRAS